MYLANLHTDMWSKYDKAEVRTGQLYWSIGGSHIPVSVMHITNGREEQEENGYSDHTGHWPSLIHKHKTSYPAWHNTNFSGVHVIFSLGGTMYQTPNSVSVEMYIIQRNFYDQMWENRKSTTEKQEIHKLVGASKHTLKNHCYKLTKLMSEVQTLGSLGVLHQAVDCPVLLHVDEGNSPDKPCSGGLRNNHPVN